MAKLKPKAKSHDIGESRIPVFKSIEEEAEFWDTHSTADFDDEFEDVDADDFKISAMLASGRLTLFLSAQQLEALEQIATSEDTNVGDVVFKLIEERLAAEHKSA